MAGKKTAMQHFRVSMTGGTSIVEFEADVSTSSKRSVAHLNRQGVITEVIPVEGHPNERKQWESSKA